MESGIRRVVIIVFDSLGIGELPDASEYGDTGSDTLDNLVRSSGGIAIPNLFSFGLGNIEGVDSIGRHPAPAASFGRMRETSKGKDTATGHWEMAGIILDKPFPTYPEGFPGEILKRFEKETGYGWLGGGAASGTEILKELGEEHIRTGRLIVYTSADSVFQIAAHEDVVPVDELYRVCAVAREFLYEYNIGRVIGRPFAGAPGSFKRTERRKDWPVEPPGTTVLERLKGKGLSVVGIGKIGDIFVHKGMTEEVHTKNDNEGVDKTIEALGRVTDGLIFTNLVDFDTLYGHRNDATGYARALERIDARLTDIKAALSDGDMLIITGDHGCDPTTPSTDHSREFVPLLVYGKKVRGGVDLGTRRTFADIGETLAEIFGVEGSPGALSFHKEVLKS